MTEWVPLHGHSWFSMLDGLGKPEKIAKRAALLEYPAIAMTDHGNISGCVDFTKACKKEGVKPILGCEFYLCGKDASIKSSENTRPYSHLVVLAKNREGWRQLIAAVSRSNTKEYSYYNPRLNLENFREYTGGGNLLCFSGHPGSDLGNAIFHSPKDAYNCQSYELLRQHHIRPDSKEVLVKLAEQYISVFGRENFFLEIQILNPDTMPACKAIATALRWLGKRLGIPCVATADSHYVERKDAYDQRVILCSKLRTTMTAVQKKLDNDEDVGLGGFFKGDHFHIPSPEEMKVHHHVGEMSQAVVISEMCEPYDITSNPRLPDFPCPDGMDSSTYLRKLCEDGLSRKKIAEGHTFEEYRDRMNLELEVFDKAGLAPYFLICQDCTTYGRSRGWLIGCGRGSAPGCLITNLIGITDIDAIKYDLYFERFYNEGRNSPGRISLPDIDMDFPIVKRDEIFRHIQKQYGVDRVAKIATFNTLQGRSALDEVLSAHEVGYDLRKQITKIIPDKARIAEELQEMVDNGEEPSIIKYSLDVYANELSEWVQVADDGTLIGSFAPYFSQAMRLEGTKKNISTHAAGVIISSTPLADLCPLRFDDSANCNIADMEYPALESMGLVKLDLLGIAALNKGEGVRDLARYGEIH